MASENTELPNKERLEELRQEGIIPYSSFVTRVLAGLAVVLSLGVVSKAVASFTEKCLRSDTLLFTSKFLNSSEVKLQVGKMFLLPAACCVAVILIVGLFQTKFFFSGVKFGIASDHTKKLRKKPRIGILFASIVIPISALIIATLGTMSFSAGVGVLIVDLPRPDGAKYIQTWVQKLYGEMCVRVALIGVVSAVAAWIISRASFLYRNRMAKKEVGER